MQDQDGNEIESPEEKLAREEKEKAAAAPKKVELTKEEEDAIIERRLGGKPDEFVKKSEQQTKVLTVEEAKELSEKKQAAALATGLEKGWIDKKQYDEYKQLQATGKVEVARKKFIEDNPGLTDAGKQFDEIYMVNEPDEIEVNEKMVPNSKKKLFEAQIVREAENYLNAKFKPVIGLESKYDNYQKETALTTKNVETVTKVVTALPEELEIPLGDGETPLKYKLTDEDRKDVQKMFLDDKNVIGKEDLKAEELSGYAKARILHRNFKAIVKAAVDTAVTEAQDRYERGEKGIVPKRETINTGSETPMEKFVRERGII